METNWTVIAAAVAAVCSAIAASLSYRAQRESHINEFRPEIDLVGWDYVPGDDTNPGHIRIREIVNHGRGAARNILFNMHTDNTRSEPVVVMNTTRIVGLLSADRTRQLNADAIVFWKNVEPNAGDSLFTKLTVYYLDTIGYRYEVVFDLIVYPSAQRVLFGSEQLAPGLFLLNRTLKRKAFWRLELKSWYQQFKIDK